MHTLFQGFRPPDALLVLMLVSSVHLIHISLSRGVGVCLALGFVDAFFAVPLTVAPFATGVDGAPVATAVVLGTMQRWTGAGLLGTM